MPTDQENNQSPDVIMPVPPGWRTQRRWPDTCDCVYQEAINPNGDETAQPRPYKIEQRCAAHKYLIGDPVAHHSVVHGENVHKNRAIMHTLEVLPDDHKHEIIDQHTGHKYLAFKYGEPKWRFNEKRELEITINNADESTRKKVSDHLKSKFAKKTIHIK